VSKSLRTARFGAVLVLVAAALTIPAASPAAAASAYLTPTDYCLGQ